MKTIVSKVIKKSEISGKGYLFILDEVNRYLKPKEDIRGGKITGQLTYI